VAKAAKRRRAPGRYEDLVDLDLERWLATLEDADFELGPELEREQAAEAFARYLYGRARAALTRVNDVEQQRALLERMLGVLELADAGPRAPTQQLLAVADPRRSTLGARRFVPAPRIPLGESDLLVNARDEFTLAAILVGELASADRVDLMCAFIRTSGLARIEPALRELVDRRRDQEPTPLRIVTTTYTGATELAALERLRELGATVFVDYEGRDTRLHAKAWVLHRDSGLSTAFVGSSNLSHSAVVDGREWNVRLSSRETPDLIRKLSDEFEAVWRSERFSCFDASRFARATDRERGTTAKRFVRFDLRPFPFQETILLELTAARELHGHHRNLIVAATGTGKTMIAAFDYQRLCKVGEPRPRLLFVAHRREILTQAHDSFRQVLGDPGFGELLVDGERPQAGDHVFASIQSLSNRLSDIDPRRYEHVVVDEFHHAEAGSYRRLLAHLTPNELLGLTATPERGDGVNVAESFFDGRIAAELRLWEALDRGLLCPFNYFGVADSVDLSGLAWQRGGYDRAALEGVYTGHHERVRQIIAAIHRYVGAPESMRALGFCVGVEHARFMAEQFSKRGIAAVAVTGSTPLDERDAAMEQLRAGQMRVVFCVDVFNEGVDLPELDTLLFLRPTESAALFLQQLGRGLRWRPAKLTTVLDFIGNAHRKFRFDLRFRAMIGGQRGLLEQVEQDFPRLPPGCSIMLEPQAREHVLANVKQALGQRNAIVAELRELAKHAGRAPTLAAFLDAMQWDPGQLYRQRRGSGWTYAELCVDAGLLAANESETSDHKKLAGSLGGLRHVDDRARIDGWGRWLSQPTPPAGSSMSAWEQRLATMLLALFYSGAVGRLRDLDDGLALIWRYPRLREEARELLALVAQKRKSVDGDFRHADRPIPLRLHAHYSRDELLAACGALRPGSDPKMQTGMRRLPDEGVILNLITIDKRASHYSPKTRYRDYALSRTIFHSETPHTAGPDTPFGRQLLAHERDGVAVLLFVRPADKDELGRTCPYLFLGATRLTAWAGDRPMQLTWELSTPIPAWFYPHTCLTV